MYTLHNSSREIIHIIEHPGYGTLHQLVLPLKTDQRQQVICTNGNEDLTFFEDKIYVLHTTGHMYPIISNLEKIIGANIKIVVFLHVAPKYLFFKGKESFLKYLYQIQQRYRTKYICPSYEVTREYLLYGIVVDNLQIGIPQIQLDSITEYKKGVIDNYAGKIITVCTNPDDRYLYIKGVDTFSDLMRYTGNERNSLILGFDGEYKGIPSVKLTNPEFLYVLSKSKLYMQLSRTECYNVTAVQSKQLMVPLIVSNNEGHKNSVPNVWCRVDTFEEALQKMNSIINEESAKEVEKNYYESMSRETILNFMTQMREYIWRLL